MGAHAQRNSSHESYLLYSFISALFCWLFGAAAIAKSLKVNTRTCLVLFVVDLYFQLLKHIVEIAQHELFILLRYLFYHQVSPSYLLWCVLCQCCRQR